MRRRGARSIGSTLFLGGVLALGLGGCGEADKSFGEAKIVDALKLEEDAQGYTLDGDPFCVLSDRFFSGSGEVDAATGDDDAGIVVASREGNVAVEGVPDFFGPDCRQRARHRLDKLDPAAGTG